MVYIAIDLKSFYASVECVERNLNPLTTNLVVADLDRTSKTICLAVTPSLKKYGLSGRSRLYEVEQTVKKINNERRKKIKYKSFIGKSFDDIELSKNSFLELDFIIAKPRMALYINYSTKIYDIYLKYVSYNDLHVYSIDEVFIDATSYLKLYKLTPYEFTMKLIQNVLKDTKITATAGIAPNLYLCKVAMDIVAKHIKENKDGVRIAILNVLNYRKYLWNHTPLTDFWRVGKGYYNKLKEYNINTMGDIARISLERENLLYKLFGVNAELLIDHAWGYESCTIADIKKYKPITHSISHSQVLHTPYNFQDARIIVMEIADTLILELVEKNLVAKRVDLVINYDVSNINENYNGNIQLDKYGRSVPKESHGFKNFDNYLSSTKLIIKYVLEIYDKIIKTNLSVRKVTIIFNDVIDYFDALNKKKVCQLDLFSDNKEEISELSQLELEKERNMQKAIIKIQNKYGKNAMLKGIDLTKKATQKDQNSQIGGHSA